MMKWNMCYRTGLAAMLVGAMVLVMPASALADEALEAAVGGGLGGAIGALIGQELGGESGAILGGALGAATGAALILDEHEQAAPSRAVRRYRFDDEWEFEDDWELDDEWGPEHCPPGHAMKGWC